MLTMLAVISPIFLLVLLGYLLRRTQFPGPGFWPASERLTYYILFPCLLVDNLSRAVFQGLPVARTGLVMLLALLALSLLLLLFRRQVPLEGPSFSSLFQGAIRPNTYVGLSAAWALFGPEGVTFSAIAILVMIPVVNILSVSVVSRFGSRNVVGAGKILVELAKNPLILACILGLFLNLTGVALPLEIPEVIGILGRASLPMGLLAVGAGLHFKGIAPAWLPVTISATSKMVLLPLITTVLCLLFSLSGPAAGIAILFTAIPTSASSYILARQLGGDHRLMAVILTAQTAAAALILPLALTLLYAWTGIGFRL